MKRTDATKKVGNHGIPNRLQEARLFEKAGLLNRGAGF